MFGLDTLTIFIIQMVLMALILVVFIWRFRKYRYMSMEDVFRAKRSPPKKHHKDDDNRSSG